MAKSKKEPVQFSVKSFIALLLAFILPFCIIVGVQKAFFKNYNVPSASMENTLMTGDRVLAFKKDTGFIPERGEIVVFKDVNGWLLNTQYGAGQNLVKRVIGLPGDTVECCSPEGYMLINSEPYEEGYILGSNEEFAPQIVPEGYMWVQGDNREDSADSRYHIEDNKAMIPLTAIESSVWLVYWPLQHFGVKE